MKENKGAKTAKNSENNIKNIGVVNKIYEKISKKWLVNIGTTLLLCIILAGIYIGGELLLKKVTLPEFDMTKDKVNSLSEETKTKISSIDKEVKITLINQPGNSALKVTLERYKSLNKNIIIEEIDNSTSRPDLERLYELDSLTLAILVESGEKNTLLNEYDLFTYDYTTYEELDVSEEAITNAIINVTSDAVPKVYFMDIHVIYPLEQYYESIMKTISDDANEVDTIDLLANGGVPKDCNILVITTLREDITDLEFKYIKEYINNGGKLLLLTGPNVLNVSLTNFQQILDMYGLGMKDGVIFEGNSANMLYNAPNIIVEDVTANSTTKNMKMNLKACFIRAGAIEIEEDKDKIEELGVRYETLATTSEKAFLRTDYAISNPSRTNKDSEESEFLIGILAEKKIDDDKSSQLIMFSNNAFDGMRDSQSNSAYKAYNNDDIVANAIAYLNDKTDIITIRKNFDSVTTYNLTKQQSTIIIGVIFLVPVTIIIIGIVVWQIRRRKK